MSAVFFKAAAVVVEPSTVLVGVATVLVEAATVSVKASTVLAEASTVFVEPSTKLVDGGAGSLGLRGSSAMIFRTRYSRDRAASPMHMKGGPSPPCVLSALAFPLRLRASA
ncbi:MAG: hypothetical protein IT450_21410 [Phycisphaerales bacterium]|nr:hypothetical protein [Phycisphaerales bacterium]